MVRLQAPTAIQNQNSSQSTPTTHSADTPSAKSAAIPPTTPASSIAPATNATIPQP